MLATVARRSTALMLLLNLCLPVQGADLVPFLADRWCQGVFLPFGQKEVDPAATDKPIEDPAAIADMPALTVQISYPDDRCSGACSEKVAVALAQSLNLWRQSCVRCQRGLMTFVVVSDKVFVDGQVWAALERSTSFHDGVLAAHAAILGDARLTGTGYVMGSYSVVARSHRKLRQFCTNELAGFQGFWPIKLAAALCAGQTAPKSPTLRIDFVVRPPCGERDYLACGKPDQKIEMDLADTGYFLRSRQGVGAGRAYVLGNRHGTSEVDLHAVFLHEVGHFLGLRHVDRLNTRNTFPPAMFRRLNNDLCVTRTDVLMLNSSADQSWAFRARAFEGLVRPELIKEEP